MSKHMKIGFLATAAIALGIFAQSCNMDTPEGIKSKKEAVSDITPTSDKITDPAKIQNKDDKNKKQAEPAAPVGPLSAIEFKETTHDFGELTQGDSVEHIFEYTNTGDEPLTLSNCKGSCGCTVPDCSKEPIMPGEKGQIRVVFNSKGKSNKQTKTVTVTANTEPAQTKLTITSMVNVPPKDEAQ